MLRFRTFAVLVAFVGTFSVSKLVDIVEDSIGADDARVGGVCRVHAKDIFLNLHENSAKSPMCMYCPPPKIFGQNLGPKCQWSVTFWPVTGESDTSETANSTVS